jgi:hypothetical protein
MALRILLSLSRASVNLWPSATISPSNRSPPLVFRKAASSGLHSSELRWHDSSRHPYIVGLTFSKIFGHAVRTKAIVIFVGLSFFAGYNYGKLILGGSDHPPLLAARQNGRGYRAPPIVDASFLKTPGQLFLSTSRLLECQRRHNHRAPFS